MKTKSSPLPKIDLRTSSIWRRYGFAWVTAALFLASFGGHWLLGWQAYVSEQAMHNMPVNSTDFLIEIGRDTLENWQSEFLQLIWQVSGLAYLFYIGSPQSSEGDMRLERKLDAILRSLNPKEAESIIASIDRPLERSER